MRCMVQVKEKYFKTKYRPLGILLKFLCYLCAILRMRLESRGQLYAQSELPLLLSFSRPGIYTAAQKSMGLCS
jgi:hypothetical protein